MPIKHAALKQLRKDRKRAKRNQAVHSSLKTFTKRMRTLIEQRNTDEVKKFLPIVISRFDQAAAKGMIHKNVASRTKSRMMQKLAKLSPPKS